MTLGFLVFAWACFSWSLRTADAEGEANWQINRA
jgi:hypothetical protein